MFMKMFTHKILKNSLYVGLSLVLLLAVQACHNENGAANLQVIHLSPDAPVLRVKDDGNQFASEFDAYAYSSSSRLVDLIAGSHDIVFRALLPDGSTPAVINLLGQSFPEQTNTLVVAMNTYDSIEPYVIVQERTTIDSAASRVRIAHLAPGTANIDVYVTAVDADLANSSALGTLSFKEEIYEASLAAGEYQIRITLAGSQTVIFDSGTLNVIGGEDITILAADSTVNGSSPLELLYLFDTNNTLLRDTNTPSDVRVIHASPTAGNLDVAFVESASSVADVFPTPLLTNLAYTTVTPYQEFVPERYNIKVAAAGTTTPILIDTDATPDFDPNNDPVFALANTYSLYLLDVRSLDADDNEVITPQDLLLNRNQRRIVTEAKLDILNAASLTGSVDVYLTPPGTDLATAVDLVPIRSGLTANTSTNFLTTVPGSYDLSITTASDVSDILVTAPNLTLTGGGLYTAVILDDLLTDTDGLPPSLLLLDDF